MADKPWVTRIVDSDSFYNYREYRHTIYQEMLSKMLDALEECGQLNMPILFTVADASWQAYVRVKAQGLDLATVKMEGVECDGAGNPAADD